MRHRLIATIFSFIACFAVYAQDVCVINGKIADDKLANGKAIKKVFLTSADEYGRRTVVAEAKVKKGSYTFKYKVSQYHNHFCQRTADHSGHRIFDFFM